MQAARTALRLAGAAALLSLAQACEPSAPGPAPVQKGVGAEASLEQGYVSPPELLQVARQPDHRLEIAGRARPRARVRLATPGGGAEFAQADGQGIWRLVSPVPSSPQLLGLSMSDRGRVLQAPGYILLTPDGTAARLRAGGGSQAAGRPQGALAITVLDYDAMFAATLSGQGGEGQPVSLRIDGLERGRASGGREGRFVLSVNQPLTPGAHAFELVSGGAQTRTTAVVTAPAPLAGAPFRAWRTAEGWRIDWLTPGGGEQTTLLFAPRPPAAAQAPPP